VIRTSGIFALSLLALAVGGCTSIGPQRLGVDRSDYANRLRETNKEQLLLNIVAMRYGDAPLFLEVSSVISQYTREGSVSANAAIDPAPDTQKGSVGANVLLRETPTVTYAPLTGERFSRSMLSPLPPASLLAMIESGWSAETLFGIAVRSINGVDNSTRTPIFAQRADPEFAGVVAALERLQRSQAIAIHVRRDEGQFTATARMSPTLGPEEIADLGYLVQKLHLPGDRKGEFSISFSSVQTRPDELAIRTRSMFEILAEMAQGVDVPGEDHGKVIATAPDTGPPLVRIHSGKAPPSDAHAAIRYRGRWFWIDGADAVSKRVFLIAQILLSLNDSSSGASAPLVTIPTG
jgi:hypothetical protein